MLSEDVYPPWGFSWIDENKLAGMGHPKRKENLNFLEQQGIRHLVTLSPEKLPPIEHYEGIEWTLIPIEEFEAPTLDDIRIFIDVCERCQLRNEPVGVHCRMGRGRTGTMAACYLVHFQGFTPERAITNMRLRRPGSVETYEQERAVRLYHDYLRSTSA